MIGSVAIIGRNQGISLVVNLFFGTILNAAHSISTHIYSVAEQFIGNVFTASKPQIIKLYASKNFSEMWKLVFRSTQLAFYLVMMLSIVLMIEMPFVLDLWLCDVPEYTVEISRILLLAILVETQNKLARRGITRSIC